LVVLALTVLMLFFLAVGVVLVVLFRDKLPL
jgi:hypothetical protein